MSIRSVLRRLRPAAVVAVAGALALASCGDDGGSSSAPSGPADERSLAAILASADKLAAVGSARMEMRVEVRGAQGAGEIAFDGAFDVAAPAAAFDVTIEGEGIPGGGITLAVRLVGGALYVDGSQLGLNQLFASGAPGVDPDARWLKLDLSGLGGGAGDPTGGLGSLGSDPSQILQALRGVGGVETVGREKVRGVETTHYRVTVDVATALDQVPAEEREQLGEALEQLGDEPIPADLWVDDDGYLRRMSMELDEPGGAGTMELVLEMFDFGEPVDVQAPPPSEVADLTAALGAMFAGGLPGVGGLPGMGGLPGFGSAN